MRRHPALGRRIAVINSPIWSISDRIAELIKGMRRAGRRAQRGNSAWVQVAPASDVVHIARPPSLSARPSVPEWKPR